MGRQSRASFRKPHEILEVSDEVHPAPDAAVRVTAAIHMVLSSNQRRRAAQFRSAHKDVEDFL